MGTAEEEDSINIVSTVIRVWEIGPGSGGIRWECGAWWRAGWGGDKEHPDVPEHRYWSGQLCWRSEQ